MVQGFTANQLLSLRLQVLFLCQRRAWKAKDQRRLGCTRCPATGQFPRRPWPPVSKPRRRDICGSCYRNGQGRGARVENALSICPLCSNLQKQRGKTLQLEKTDPFNSVESPEVSAAGLCSFRIKVCRNVGSQIPFVRVLKDQPLRLRMLLLLW